MPITLTQYALIYKETKRTWVYPKKPITSNKQLRLAILLGRGLLRIKDHPHSGIDTVSNSFRYEEAIKVYNILLNQLLGRYSKY